MAEAKQYTGRVKFYKDDELYGFIIEDGKPDEVFFHYTNITRNDYHPKGGDPVQFQKVPSKRHNGKFNAVAVRYIGLADKTPAPHKAVTPSSGYAGRDQQPSRF